MKKFLKKLALGILTMSIIIGMMIPVFAANTGDTSPDSSYTHHLAY